MNIKKFIVFLGVLIPLGFLLYPTALALISCAPQVVNRPKPQYGDLYSFPKYNIPEARKAGSVNLTAVIIIPEYKDTLNQEYAGGAKVSARGGISHDMLKVFKSFAGSLGEDIEAQLVAKGMTTKGPFSLAEVTYPDKKGADLTVSTNAIFDINYTKPTFSREDHYEGGISANVYSCTMTVGIKIYYYMLEPMSGEKMWIKKLDLGVQEYPYHYGVKTEQYVSGHGGCGEPIYGWRATDEFVFDERVKIFSDILKGAYPQIMKTSWNYLDTSEMLNLKSKSQEIRDRKRY